MSNKIKDKTTEMKKAIDDKFSEVKKELSKIKHQK